MKKQNISDTDLEFLKLYNFWVFGIYSGITFLIV